MFSFLNRFFLPERSREFLTALKCIDYLFENQSAYKLIREKVTSEIILYHTQGDHIMDYMHNENFTPKVKVLYLIQAVALKLLSSHLYHCDSGVLNKMGDSLSSIYKIAETDLERGENYSTEDRSVRMKALNDVINN